MNRDAPIGVFDSGFGGLSAARELRRLLPGEDLVYFGDNARIPYGDRSPDTITEYSLQDAAFLLSKGVKAILVACGTVSSTRIRKALSEGRVEDASAMLGYDYSISGVVVPGKRLGRTIGFPTANLRLADPLKMIPAKGVYLTRTEVLGNVYDSMTNVGDIVETNIFGFGDDIYSLAVRVSFVRRLRDMKKIGSLEELRAQLAGDRALCLQMIAEADSK